MWASSVFVKGFWSDTVAKRKKEKKVRMFIFEKVKK
jgi:hypothetical protein